SDTTSNGQPQLDFAALPPGILVSPSNYKGVCGNNWGWGVDQYTPPGGTRNGLYQGHGIFYPTDGIPHTTGHGALPMTNITDGTSNTFLIGEDIPALDDWCSWPFFNHVTSTCAIPLNYSNGVANDWANNYSFHSRHTNGANFAF